MIGNFVLMSILLSIIVDAYTWVRTQREDWSRLVRQLDEAAAGAGTNAPEQRRRMYSALGGWNQPLHHNHHERSSIAEQQVGATATEC